MTELRYLHNCVYVGVVGGSRGGELDRMYEKEIRNKSDTRPSSVTTAPQHHSTALLSTLTARTDQELRPQPRDISAAKRWNLLWFFGSTTMLPPHDANPVLPVAEGGDPYASPGKRLVIGGAAVGSLVPLAEVEEEWRGVVDVEGRISRRPQSNPFQPARHLHAAPAMHAPFSWHPASFRHVYLLTNATFSRGVVAASVQLFFRTWTCS